MHAASILLCRDWIGCVKVANSPPSGMYLRSVVTCVCLEQITCASCLQLSKAISRQKHSKTLIICQNHLPFLKSLPFALLPLLAASPPFATAAPLAERAGKSNPFTRSFCGVDTIQPSQNSQNSTQANSTRQRRHVRVLCISCALH